MTWLSAVRYYIKRELILEYHVFEQLKLCFVDRVFTLDKIRILTHNYW